VPPARPPRLNLSKAPFWHRAAEWLLHALAISAIVAIVLILVFTAKEAAPILYSNVVREEVTLTKMWIPQLWQGYDESQSVWQPVSDIPKFGVWPLILGTLKVTIVAMAVAVPLGVGAAVYVSQYAGARTVLASLWAVNDESTAFLMDRFYRGLRGGLSKDKALRAAQVEMLAGPRSHPALWAAFQLSGDWK
jgi:hypothetical protein